jgi:hypothetical protein
MYSLTAVLSAIFYLLELRLLRWRLNGREIDGDRIWRNLRAFSGWVSAGCFAGVVAFSLQMRSLDLEFDSMLALAYRYSASSHVFVSVHFLCVIASMNLLLRRVSDHASHSYYNVARDHEVGRITDDGKFDWRDCIGQYAMYKLVRLLNVVTVLLCALIVVARIVASGYFAQAAANPFGEQLALAKSSANKCIAASRALEAAVLVLMALGFLLFSPACIVMFRRVEGKLSTILQEMNLRSDQGTAFLPYEFSPPEADGSMSQVEMPIVEARQFLSGIKAYAVAQRRRLILCLVLVLIAVVALASLTLLFVFITFNAPSTGSSDPACAPCSESCQDLATLMRTWWEYTPGLNALVASLCSAPPLMFSFWLMTTSHDRALLTNPQKFRSDAGELTPFETEKDLRIRAECIRMGINLRSTTY